MRPRISAAVRFSDKRRSFSQFNTRRDALAALDERARFGEAESNGNAKRNLCANGYLKKEASYITDRSEKGGEALEARIKDYVERVNAVLAIAEEPRGVRASIIIVTAR